MYVTIPGIETNEKDTDFKELTVHSRKQKINHKIQCNEQFDKIIHRILIKEDIEVTQLAKGILE